MIKELKVLLIVILGLLISCKQQKEEKQNADLKQVKTDDSKYLLKKENNVGVFALSDIQGKWELKKASNPNSDNLDTSNFELLEREFILGDENCDASFEIDSIHNLEYHIEGHFYNHSLEEEMKSLDKKIYDLFKIKLNTFKGVIITKCSPPFHKIYRFGDDLLVWYSGDYMQFVKSKNTKVLLFKCKENDNGISRYDDPLNKTCVCNESTFSKAYEIFYNESPNYLKKDLLKKLPQSNFKTRSEDAEVEYKWILQDTLKIEMSFQGGENRYIFYKKDNNKIEYKEYLSLP
ncbi:hypothetical protein CFS9_03560 [Flavobacterium sp. CFS9]|uniref:Lipocalin-like domain-containing protein n=1 Tax=Flavobacterium sp. CFS9 TaxID=3143118 RepID=A0AAT9GWV3_9FLAO